MERDAQPIPARELPQLKRAALTAFALVAVLWFVKLLELAGPDDLGWLGVWPRSWKGLAGILTSPLIHGGFEHLIFNSVPLLVLLTLALFNYPRATRRALPLVWLLSGIGIWLIGRPSWHIGASGLTHGLMFFLFFLGLLRQDRGAIAIALIVFFLYGGMVMTVLPREMGVSWEAHMSGAIAGTLSAWLWRRLDPPAPEPKPSWEEEDEIDRDDDQFEPVRPVDVPVLWRRPPETRGSVIAFPRAPRDDAGGDPPTLH
jgi:membrane associated rhomboid family serine protease